MASNIWIKIHTEINTATQAQQLKSAIADLRRAIDSLTFIRKKMENMTNETDFALIEELYGLDAGKGTTVYALVNGALGAGAKSLTEQVG